MFVCFCTTFLNIGSYLQLHFYDMGDHNVRKQIKSTGNFRTNKIFCGYQTCQLVKNGRRFRTYICLHHQNMICAYVPIIRTY